MLFSFPDKSRVTLNNVERRRVLLSFYKSVIGTLLPLPDQQQQKGEYHMSNLVNFIQNLYYVYKIGHDDLTAMKIDEQ